ncbi:GtrA family protein [Streptomyces xiangluensis]|uniref:GtrA family protein n=1 Tax=Streptomyces xiangluensis TaxID=2665720 RepID=A0ABV8Z3I2_9ACTN
MTRIPQTARQFAGFTVIGVVNTSVYYMVFLVADIWLHYIAAYGISFSVTVAVSFVLNSVITYRIRPTWRGAFRFPLSNLLNLAVAGAVLQAGVTAFHMSANLAALIAGVLVTPLSFLLSRWALLPQVEQRAQPGS